MLHNKNKDKGFSMIELVVTIAIMGIVTLASIGIYSWIASSSFKQAYKSITDVMQYARTEKLSKAGTSDDWAITIEIDSDGKCVSTVEKSSGTTVKTTKSKKNVKIEAVKKADGSLSELTSGNKVFIKYKSNGAFKTDETKMDTGEEIEGIKVSYGRYSKTIKFALNTGKFFIE